MLNAVIQWTIESCPEYPHGHPCLHKRIGYVYWSGNWGYIFQLNLMYWLTFLSQISMTDIPRMYDNIGVLANIGLKRQYTVSTN